MQLESILSEGCTLNGAAWGSKKRVLEQASSLLASQYPNLDLDDIFNGLIGRERLGSTGLGDGIAIPHCRLEGCEQVIGALIHLAEPVDFDARDGQPVDLVFVLIAPEQAHDSHLQALASVASLMQSADNRARLRRADSDSHLYRTAVGLA
ncbi:PTS IIA-like nitrogen regulatory protein PtsN [Balneatrix alpica]|uniref:PTS IIA-like nitrogen regulatory protein PtsN n=1 Tax=Balneatrix alpica TaxID=75684 RepID=A0ABV5Z901_9GAMM|nr:PTS IIA-like nitrogen regulatory protein PtsN [Balneatrix alpica]